MRIVSIGDNLLEMSNPDQILFSVENKKTISKSSSAENFTQMAER